LGKEKGRLYRRQHNKGFLVKKSIKKGGGGESGEPKKNICEEEEDVAKAC